MQFFTKILLCLFVSMSLSMISCETLEHNNPFDPDNPEYNVPDDFEERDFELGDTGVQISMIWIPAGSFWMGAQSDEYDAYGDEYPRHQITISEGFWIGKYEVTQSQWETVAGYENFRWPGNPDRPAENVSHNDIINDFLPELDSEWRLPSEAEWAFACRAGNDHTWFWWGSSYGNLDDYAWYYDNSDIGSGRETHDVGGKIPNPWGLYDMHGNVMEWCSDWYGIDYYQFGPPVDPQGPDSGSERLRKGGGRSFYAESCRTAYRNGSNPSERNSDLGFRVVRNFN